MSDPAILILSRLVTETVGRVTEPDFPISRLGRITRKVNGLLEARGIETTPTVASPEAELLWLKGDLVEAAAALAAKRGTDLGSATLELQEKLGNQGVLDLIERRIDALLDHDGIGWDD